MIVKRSSNKISQRFLPTKREAKPRNIRLLAFDTEFDTDTGAFICGAYYGEWRDKHGRLRVTSEYCETVEEFQQTFERLEKSLGTKNRFTLVGFNTSVDMVYLDKLVNTSTILEAGSRFITARTHGGTKFIDCSNHVMGSLQSWIERLDMEKNHGIIKREGYLDSEEGKREQVLDDAKATFVLATWIKDLYADKWGITFPLTKFGAALKIFQKHYFEDAWYRKHSEQWKNDYERESYYGGRVEIFMKGTYNVHSYDINAMYVSIMRDELIPNPTVSKYLKDSKEILTLFEKGEFLTMDVTVTTPKRKVGLLPRRDTDNNKLVFPYGTWRGKYNSVELGAACKHGAVIEEVHSALWYPKSMKYFSVYADMTLQGRARCKKEGDNATEQFYKYLGNGLYGKFGQRNPVGGEYIHIDDYKGDTEGLTIHWMDEDEGYVSVPKCEAEDSMHTFPVVSATITAYARSMMLEALIANEDVIVYCDTDSIKVLRPAEGIQVGELPGQFGFEYEREETFLGCKCYGDKRKGVPKTALRVCPLYDAAGLWVGGDAGTAEYWIYDKWIKRRTAILHNKVQNTVVKSVKHLKHIDTKRNWNGDTSMPLFIDIYNNINIPAPV